MGICVLDRTGVMREKGTAEGTVGGGEREEGKRSKFVNK